MEKCTKAAAIFHDVSNFFQENKRSCAWLVCTDGTPALLGLQSGFITRAKKKRNPSVIGKHFILHREALASRILLAEMSDVLNATIEVVNFVKSGAFKSSLFKSLCQDKESKHEAFLFHANV
ncbi:protein FAM200B-like [Oratosquilla oratoria]|uniref:protein FAM200B-like n=1 Tax=Oratosquilla oratoria TaxID=337810 RepID=UPI003F769471